MALLLRVEEGAAELGIGRSRMFALIRAGEVESVLVGGSRRIVRESLLAYVKRLVDEQRGPRTEAPSGAASTDGGLGVINAAQRTRDHGGHQVESRVPRLERGQPCLD